jgi:hypothetical protein
MAGALLAVLLYKIIKALEYESANPDPELAVVEYFNNTEMAGAQTDSSSDQRVKRSLGDRPSNGSVE